MRGKLTGDVMRDGSSRLLGLIEFATALFSVIAVAALLASVVLLHRIGGTSAIVSAALIGVAAATGAVVMLLRPARLARVRTAGTLNRPADRGSADVTAVAHDLRSPLVTVHAYLELLTEEAFGLISSEAREAGERATRAAGRAQSLIDDTLRR